MRCREQNGDADEQLPLSADSPQKTRCYAERAYHLCTMPDSMNVAARSASTGAEKK